MSSLPLDIFDALHREMMAAKHVVIISHRNPDADSIGANLALREQLEKLGKTVVSACADPIPESSHFLNKAEEFQRDFQLSDFDLVITVDCGSHELMKFHEWKPELLDRQKVRLLNIDHHATNDFFGNVNLVMEETPSTCFMLFLCFVYWGWDISQSSATALLHGLYYDTGSFMHSNTSSDTLRIAGRLKALRADHETSVKKQFCTKKLQQLRLWGHALERLHLNKYGGAVTFLRPEDFQKESADSEDSSGLIDLLNHTKEARFVLLATEDKPGKIRGSLRTHRNDIDLSRIAKLFGGGGHKKAAGFTSPGTFEERIHYEVS